MSNPTLTLAADPAVPAGAPGWGGLLRSEIRRARSRRSLWWMSGLALLGVLAVSAILFATTGAVDQSDLDAAADRALIEQQGWYQQCLDDPNIAQSDKANACWMPPEADIRRDAIYWVSPQPFTNDTLTGLLVFAGGIASVVALLIGASAGGADWGARTMGLLFSWEPRRLRVFLTRLFVVLVMGLVITALCVCLAWITGSLIAQVHGLDPSVTLPADASSLRSADTDAAVELAVRWLPLGVLAAAGGLAVAMATRSTGWAIGATIAIIAIAEPLVQALWPWGSQWLVQTNVLAWMSDGMTWTVNRNAASGALGSGPSNVQPGSIYLSDVRGLAVLAAMVVIVLGVAAYLLRSRDVD